ncbi:MAG TPA: YeeE/YedE family protein [Burkholderiales bacterium]|nr:YeeE/YedE family protein [Burkholderiales bacterium]
MTIDWAHFTPWASLAGGVLIGVGAALLVLFSGRIAGISGIVGGLFMPRGRMDTAWRLSFLGGLLVAPLIFLLLKQPGEVRIHAGFATLALAGFLVGVGTRYGSGCTSGHGVCGVSRLSPRSLVATAAFMVAGFATVFVVRHVLA